jgi:hypothetical protein
MVRIAAHVHSAWSYDGEWALDGLVREFRRRGYDAVLMAEHDHGFDQKRWIAYQEACAECSTSDLLLIPGMEYADPDNVVHTTIWGDAIPFFGSGRPTLSVLCDASEHNAASVFAHPLRRNALSRYRTEWAPFLTAVEIWNRKYDGVAPRPALETFARQEQLARFASLDFHTRRQFFPLAMCVSLQQPVSPSAVVREIRAGACRPEFLRLSAIRCTRGVEGATLRGLEDARRLVRDPVRRLQGAMRR